ncbi:MAG TPA: hypothetical protein VGR34_06380 [Candidatus Dormibacteraeota bacterium]|nr:hypothetical protein [Candidatus Dormibacteraeota bacterium]
MGITKTKQISFKVEDALGQRIEAVAEAEDIPVADFVRKIFLWGLDQYEAIGSIRALRFMVLPDELIEKTLKEERQAHRELLRRRKK